MSDSEERIREMVRGALEENPRIRNKTLLERAKEIDAGAVEGLSLRQFHGKFRLPVARALSDAAPVAKPKERRAARPARQDAGVARDVSKQDAVRDIFRRFAVQLARAEGRSEIVRAAARIDEFVDEVFRALGGPDGTDAPPPGKAPQSRKRTRPAKARPAEAPPAADAAESPAPASTLVGEPQARDMRRRRRPKAMLEAAAAAAAETTSPEEKATDVAEDAVEPPAGPESDATFNLSHDLEEFRRRKFERERGSRGMP